MKAEVDRGFVLKELSFASEFVGISIIYNDEESTISFNHVNGIKRCLILKWTTVRQCLHQWKKCIKFIAQKVRVTEGVPYCEAVGLLLYFALCTGPDMPYAFSALA